MTFFLQPQYHTKFFINQGLYWAECPFLMGFTVYTSMVEWRSWSNGCTLHVLLGLGSNPIKSQSTDRLFWGFCGFLHLSRSARCHKADTALTPNSLVYRYHFRLLLCTAYFKYWLHNWLSWLRITRCLHTNSGIVPQSGHDWFLPNTFQFICYHTLYNLVQYILSSTAYGLDGPGIESRWGEIFRTSPDWPWVPSSLLYNGYWVFPRGKVLPGRDADTSPPSSAEV